HDLRLEAEQPQGARGLEAEEAAADDDAVPASFGAGLDRLEVLDGAVDEHAVEVGALDGRDERGRAGGEDELVVGVGAARGADGAGGAVEGRRRLAEAQVHARQVGGEGESFGADAVEERREADPVVGGTWLLGEDRDGPGGVALGDRLEEAAADHAVADHYQSLVAHADTSFKIVAASSRPVVVPLSHAHTPATSSTQVPQPVEACVASDSASGVRAPERNASASAFLVTLLHRQTTASSGMDAGVAGATETDSPGRPIRRVRRSCGTGSPVSKSCTTWPTIGLSPSMTAPARRPFPSMTRRA